LAGIGVEHGGRLFSDGVFHGGVGGVQQFVFHGSITSFGVGT
jgi:hypothetical protein